MTTLALLPEPIKRLFDRVDVTAPHPDLETAREYWSSCRGNRLFPAVASLDLAAAGDAADDLFVLAQNDEVARDWDLVSVGKRARSVLELESSQPRLQTLGDRRLAARIRRLLDLVRETGEPVAASSSMRSGTRYVHTHLLVAPLSSDGHHIDGALGGVIRD